MKVALVLKGDIRGIAHFHRDFRELRESLPGFEFTLLESRQPGEAVELARGACGDCDYLIAAGGDGTVNEVLNGAMAAGGTPPALGVLAYGTANDLVRTLRMRGGVQDLVPLLAGDIRHPVDIGSIHYRDADDQPRSRYFLNAADIGIGAELVRQLQNRRRLVGSNLHYLRSIIRGLRGYEPRELIATSDQGLDWQGRSLALVAGNGRFFGSGLCVAPGARLDDGDLFITLVGEAHAWDFVRNLGRLKRGELLQHPAVSYHHASRLQVEHGEQKTCVEVDGEWLGYTPLSIEVAPAAVEFLMPGPV